MNIWISIHEGRNRQVRRMLESLGFTVQRLKRVEYARIGLEGLKPGEWRYLSPEELDQARKLATPKQPVVHKSPEEKTAKKKGKKKKKKEKVKQESPQSTGSDVLDSISKELENISEKISNTGEEEDKEQ
jgi:hypothetical protein